MEKVIKVIESCLTFEQLEKARDYKLLYLYATGWNHDDVIKLINVYANQYIKILRS